MNSNVREILNNKAVGQSAIEYLMTYGWMLLVVAVAGGAIFATVGDQSVDSTSGFTGGDVQIDNFGVSSDDELGLEIRSTSGSEVVISQVNVSDSSTGNWIYKEFTGEKRVGVGSSRIFELPNVTRTDSGNELEVEIVYDSGGLSNMAVSGTVTGNLELTDTGSYEGLPEDDHEPISGENGGESEELTLLDTVNYTYDDSGDVQVNESTAGDDGYQVDLNNDFSEEVEEITILEMHGADGGDGAEEGGSGGLIENAAADVSNKDSLEIWVGEEGIQSSDPDDRGWGRSLGGGVVVAGPATGGGSTEIWIDSESEFLATADAGGGSGGAFTGTDGETEYLGGGGGARGGDGGDGTDQDGESAEGTGFGGDGGDSSEEEIEDGDPGGQELGLADLEADGNEQTGGSSEGHGWILIEYYG